MSIKYGVYIGRFQPFHLGHAHIIEQALNIGIEKIIILIGSPTYEIICGRTYRNLGIICGRTYRNPFYYKERHDTIISWGRENLRPKIPLDELLIVRPISDQNNNDIWVASVKEKVWRLADGDDNITIIGHSKDSSSYYPKLFPEWPLIEFPSFICDGKVINSTDIRNRYFSVKDPNTLVGVDRRIVPESTVDLLIKNKNKNYFENNEVT